MTRKKLQESEGHDEQNGQRAHVTDVFVRAPEDRSEFYHLHSFSHSHHSLDKPLVADKRHMCVAFVHIFSPNLLSRSDAEKVMAERAQ